MYTKTMRSSLTRGPLLLLGCTALLLAASVAPNESDKHDTISEVTSESPTAITTQAPEQNVTEKRQQLVGATTLAPADKEQAGEPAPAPTPAPSLNSSEQVAKKKKEKKEVESEKSECEDDLYCFNGGVCIISPATGQKTCICPPEYHGSRCQLRNLCKFPIVGQLTGEQICARLQRPCVLSDKFFRCECLEFLVNGVSTIRRRYHTDPDCISPPDDRTRTCRTVCRRYS